MIPILLLAFLPDQVQLRNYLWIAPSAAYNLVVFPAWNRGRYGPTALMARSLYGWAHFFALLDLLCGRRQGWQTTGAGGKRSTKRIWWAIALWGGMSGFLWLGLAIYRSATMKPINFAFLTLMAIMYLSTCVVMPFVARIRASGEPEMVLTGRRVSSRVKL